MITSYEGRTGTLSQERQSSSLAIANAVWVDVESPTESERELIKQGLGVDLPSYQDMHEIEASSRLYAAGDTLFMIAPVLAQADTASPQIGALGFILKPDVVITLRFLDPRSITLFVQRAKRNPALCETPVNAFTGILDTLVDRMADVLENVAARIEGMSQEVFLAHNPASSRERLDLQEIVRGVGRAGEMISKARDSLAALARMVAYFNAMRGKLSSEQNARLKTVNRDIRSLVEHADFQSQRATFLLDAALGLISYQQSRIVKTFSVAATGFLPPTLIASIYGMNFEVMPELDLAIGYPIALGLMVLSAVIPLWYFHRRGWL